MLSDVNPWADDLYDDFKRERKLKPAERPATSWTSGLTPDITSRAPGADLSPLMRAALGLPARPTVEQIAELRGMEPDNVPATQGQRFSALLIDGLIYSAAVVLILGIMGTFGLGTSDFATLFAAILITPIGFFGFRSLTEGIFEGSPGKHMMGLRVVGQRNLPISNAQAAKRNLWHLTLMLPPVWPIAALVMSLTGSTDPLKQNRADQWSQTQVVHKKPQEELMRRQLKHAERFGPDALRKLR